MNKIIILFNILIFIFIYKYFTNINTKRLIEMYKRSYSSVNVIIQAGLGNRLMSFAGIIILSIYYELKPISIIEYIHYSNELERI